MLRLSDFHLREVGTALAVLAFCMLVPGAGTAQTESWGDEFPHEFSNPEARDLGPEGPEIKEPLFAFLVSLTRTDSLGVWTQDDLQAVLDSLAVSSSFPTDTIVSIERRRPTSQEMTSWPRAAVKAVWEVEFREDLERKMPYSILGYHPGSLRISRRMVLTEVLAGRLTFRGGGEVFTVRDVAMFRLDQGYLVLDVDGLVDRLLGKALDDSGTVGFVLAREDDRLLGLAVSLGKNGRRIYGEFDFRRDEVLPNGRPLAKGLSAACRQRMLEDYSGPPLGRWVDGP